MLAVGRLPAADCWRVRLRLHTLFHRFPMGIAPHTHGSYPDKPL